MEIGLLGPMTVSEGSRDLLPQRPKQRMLLAVLALQANDVVAVEELAEALWGLDPPPTAANALQGHVSALRKLLGAERIETRPPGYRLRLEPDELDVERFESLVAAAQADADPERRAPLASEALELIRGEPLSDFRYQPFAADAIRHIEELRLAALEELFEAQLALGRDVELVPELRQFAEEEPLRERVHGQLMLALYRGGRQAEALNVYRSLRAALVKELGLEPGPELRALHRSILAQSPGLIMQPAAGDGHPELPSAVPAGLSSSKTVARREPAFGRRRTLATVLLVVAALLAGLAVTFGRGGEPAVAPDSLVGLDPATGKVTATVPVGGTPVGVVVAAGSLWVANLDDSTVTRVDPGTARIVRTIPVGAPPSGIAATPGAVWVLGLDGVVRRIDPIFNRVVAQITVGRFERDVNALPPIAAAGDAVVVGGQQLGVATALSALYRIDARTDKVYLLRALGDTPSRVVIDRHAVWATGALSDSVSRVDLADGRVTTVRVGPEPQALAEGAGAVWVAATGGDTVARIDPLSNAIVATVPTGSEASAISVAGHSVWASDEDGTLVAIDPATNRIARRIRLGNLSSNVVLSDGRLWTAVSRPSAPTASHPLARTLRVLTPYQPPTDPALAGTFPDDLAVLYATCAKLFNYPDEPAPAGTSLRPEVAKSFPTITQDGRRYTIRIRSGFRFSPPSNERLTAQTFKYTIERALSPTMHSYATHIISDIVGEHAYETRRTRHISGLTADGNALTITLSRPDGGLLARLASPFFCAVPVGTPLDPSGVPTVPSAGPYYVASYSANAGFVLKRNPNYRGDRPRHWGEIVYSIGPSLAHDARAVETSRADYAPLLPFGITPSLSRRFGAGSPAAKRGAQQFFAEPSMAIFYLALNTSRPLFANPAARRAVNYGIDRARFGRLSAGSQLAAGLFASDQYVPVNMPTFEPQPTYGVHPDLGRARRNFHFRHQTAVFYTCDDSVCAAWAQLLTRQLARLGLSLKTRTFSMSTLEAKTSTEGASFDLTTKGWWADYADPADFLNVLLDGRSIHRSNNDDVSYFADSHVEHELDAASRLTGAARARAYSKLARYLAANAAPWVPLASIEWYSFFSRRIGCQVLHPIYYVDLGALCVRR